MAARKTSPARAGLPSEASRGEMLLTLATVLLVSACIYALTQSVVRWTV